MGGFSLSISYDPSTYSAIICRGQLDKFVWDELILICSTDGRELPDDHTISLPWFEFQARMVEVGKIISKKLLAVEYNESALKLISSYKNDLTSIKKASQESKIVVDNGRLSGLGFKRALTENQLRDINKLLGIRHGANFSVPGAGKTTSLLAIHSVIRSEGVVNKLLVVAPRNAFISWEEEVNFCYGLDSISIERLTGGSDRIKRILSDSPEMSIITYQQLPYVINSVHDFIRSNSVHLVLDESHRIKRGYEGKYCSSVLKISPSAKRRDILSGTPLPQGISDLMPQFEYLWPGIDIFDDISMNDDRSLGVLYGRIMPLYSRTTKNDLGLKPPSIRFHTIEMGPVQKKIYDLLRQESVRKLEKISKQDRLRFRAIGQQSIKLLQAATNPLLLASNMDYDSDKDESDIPETISWEILSEYAKYERPFKINAVLNRVRDIVNDGKKVLVWSSFVKNIELLESELKDLNPVSIYGAIDTGDENDSQTREGRIRKFHINSDCHVMIANPAACGEGISLHKVCHDAIYLDRTFNAAHYLQSIDRIHRLGLNPSTETNIEIFIMSNSIDGIVQKRLKDKIGRMEAVLNDHSLKIFAYDPEDIIDDTILGIDAEDARLIVNHIVDNYEASDD